MLTILLAFLQSLLLLFALVVVLHHMTRPGSILRGVQIYLNYLIPARVRIWVISTVIAPNKHISCKSCSSRTRPSVTATMIVLFVFVLKRKKARFCCVALFLCFYICTHTRNTCIKHVCMLCVIYI